MPFAGDRSSDGIGVSAARMQQFQRTAFGEYILHDRIGAGGMAEIFLATAQGIEGFEKRLVIKRILPTFTGDDQFVRMFIEEAKLCVALRHPNIVQVYDLGEIDGQYFIAMEYVDGRDLLKTLAACGKKRIGFPTDIALYIVMEVLKGLDYAHNLKRPDGRPLGIIHRDVSPSNVLLSFEGEVKIADFGIAKASTREKTETGILKGKFGYMAPEQVTGAPIDHRADIFAIGILLYELLTGHRLFAGKNDLQVLERVRDAQIEPPPRHYRPDLAVELERIVMSALARDPRVRFQMAAELHDALYEYTFKSRATIGPPQLAYFLQDLFLSDPEEIERRQRVLLPAIARGGPVRANGAQNGVAPGRDSDARARLSDLDLSGLERSALQAFGSGVQGSAAAADQTGEDVPSSGMFEEKTPLLLHPGDGGIAPSERATPLLSPGSQVVYIAPDECWERPVREASGSFEDRRLHKDESADETPLINVSSQESLRVPVLRRQEPRALSIASLAPSGVSAPARPLLSAPSERRERTERTEFSALARPRNASLARVDLGTGRAVGATRAPRATEAIEAIRAIRKQREENQETDLDLDDGGRSAGQPVATLSEVQVNEYRPRAPSVTVDENRARPPADDRSSSGLDTVVNEKSAEPKAAESERAWAPSEIVERTQSSQSEDDGEPTGAYRDEIEPTVRFDSSISLRGLREEEDLEEASPSDLIEVEPTGARTFPEEPSPLFLEPGKCLQPLEPRQLQPEDAYHAEEHSDFGTLEVLESDLPTSEVSESVLLSLDLRKPTRPNQERSPSFNAIVEPPSVPEDADDEPTRSVSERIEVLTADENPTRDGGARAETGLPTSPDHLQPPSDTTVRDERGPEVFDPSAQVEAVSDVELETEDGSRPVPFGLGDDPSGATEESVRLSATDKNEAVNKASAAVGPVPEPRAPSRRRPITGQRSRPVLLPAAEDEAGLSLARRPPSRRTASAARMPGKMPSPARRRITALSGLSVVNPTAQSDQARLEPRFEARLASTIEVGGEATGRGMLVDEATDSGELASPLARAAALDLPRRRDSSGVTAAVSESIMIDEQIREIRSQSQVSPQERTAFGALADDRKRDEAKRSASTSAVTSQIEEVGEDGKTDLHREMMKRQARRRFATNNVVLFGEDDRSRGPSVPGEREDSDQDPALTSAGRLDDSGASDLFGALSMLESNALEIRTKTFDHEEEISLDTDAGHGDEGASQRDLIAPSVVMELEEKRGLRNEPAKPKPASPSERDLSLTGLGSLAGDEFPEPRPGAPRAFADPAGNSIVPGAAPPPLTEDTASVTDGQVMEISAVIRSDLPPGAVSEPELDARPPSGIEIAFDSLRSDLDEGPIEDLDDESSTAIEDAPERGLAGVRGEPGRKRAPQGAPRANGAGKGAVHADPARHEPAKRDLDQPAAQPDDSDPSDPADPKRAELRLVSASFDLSSPAPAFSRPPNGAARRGPGGQGSQGQGRSNGRPPLEPTPSATPPPSPKPRGRPDGSPARAAVERGRPAREVVRTNGQLQPPPPPPPSAKGAPRPALAAAGARGAGMPVGMAPSATQGYSAGGRPLGLNKMLTVIVLLATVLAVAAAVTLLLERNRSPVAIAPLSTAPSRTAIGPPPMPSPDPVRRPAPPPATPATDGVKKSASEGRAPPPPPPAQAPKEPRAKEEAERAPRELRAHDEPAAASKHARPKKSAAKKPRIARSSAAPPPREPDAPADASVGTVEVACSEPSVVNIGRKKFSDVTKKRLKIEPGSYAVVITRPGKRSTAFVTVIGGQSVPLPCD